MLKVIKIKVHLKDIKIPLFWSACFIDQTMTFSRRTLIQIFPQKFSNKTGKQKSQNHVYTEIKYSNKNGHQ